MDTKFHGSILGSDNILILSGRRVCLIYDGDFSSYLVEHALPLLDADQRLERVGFTEEDFKHVLKIAVQISLENQKKLQYLRMEDKRYLKFNKDKIVDYYEITNESIKQGSRIISGFLQHRALTNLQEASIVMEWHI